MTRRLSRRGFTLIEVIVSLVLIVGIAAFTFASLRSSFAMRDYMEQEDATDRSARVALQKIERELRLAFLTKNTQAVNTYKTVFVGKNDEDLDTLWFATFAHRRMYHGTPEGDQAEITIWVDDGPDKNSKVLYHRESGRIDEDPDSDGTILPLATGVVKFDLDFLDSKTDEWSEDWDSTGSQQNKLPRAVQILLVLQGPDPEDEDRTVDHTYLTTVLLDMADPINKDTTNSGSGSGSGSGTQTGGTQTGGTQTGGSTRSTPGAAAEMTSVWRELTRRRGGRRRRRSGVALLMVVAVLMVMTTLVTDVTYASRVRLLVATHERDRAEAYYLARSGVLMYQLVLVADRYVKEQLGQYLGVSLSLWQMIPVINTGLMRMIFAAQGDKSTVNQDEVNTFLTTGQVSETVANAALEESSGSVFGDKAFLDFTGDFSAILTDEDSKIAVNAFKNMPANSDYTALTEDPTYLALTGLFSTQENDDWFNEHNLDKTELIANLADWIDTDSTRMVSSGGDESSLYSNLGLEDDYMVKNAPFDSLEEIREVSGWSDDVFDRFKDKLTVWGRGKINVCSISDDMLEAVLKASNPTITDFTNYIETYKTYVSTDGCPDKKQDWVDYWVNTEGLQISDSIQKEMTTSSKTFTIKSTGLVNQSSVTITAVIDMSTNAYGDIVFWKEE